MRLHLGSFVLVSLKSLGGRDGGREEVRNRDQERKRFQPLSSPPDEATKVSVCQGWLP